MKNPENFIMMLTYQHREADLDELFNRLAPETIVPDPEPRPRRLVPVPDLADLFESLNPVLA